MMCHGVATEVLTVTFQFITGGAPGATMEHLEPPHLSLHSQHTFTVLRYQKLHLTVPVMMTIHKQAELFCNISDSGYAQLHSKHKIDIVPRICM